MPFFLGQNSYETPGLIVSYFSDKQIVIVWALIPDSDINVGGRDQMHKLMLHKNVHVDEY